MSAAPVDAQDGQDERVILHLSDWNYRDKYYELPLTLLKEFHGRALADRGAAWDWFTGQIDYGSPDDKGKPIKTGRIDTGLDVFYMDWEDCTESLNEWKEQF